MGYTTLCVYKLLILLCSVNMMLLCSVNMMLLCSVSMMLLCNVNMMLLCSVNMMLLCSVNMMFLCSVNMLLCSVNMISVGCVWILGINIALQLVDILSEINNRRYLLFTQYKLLVVIDMNKG